MRVAPCGWRWGTTKPVRNYSVLSDLLDHALQKGIFITADLIISVADVPLIGLNLKLTLASIETMLSCGLMRDWDESYRCCDPVLETGGYQEMEWNTGEKVIGNLADKRL